MKKALLIILGSGAIHFSGQAQSAGQVAERFRTLINANQSGFNQKINQSLTNKTIMKKTIILSIMTTLIMSAADAQDKTADKEAIRNVVSILEKGWNAKSGKIFSSGFADRHDYIVWTGLYFPDQTVDANAMGHQGIFNTVYKTTDLKMKVDKVKFVRDDLAMVHVLGATYETGSVVPVNPKVIITMLMEKKANEWKIISFHNCDLELSFEPGAQNGSPIPLEVMFGGWYNK